MSDKHESNVSTDGAAREGHDGNEIKFQVGDLCSDSGSVFAYLSTNVSFEVRVLDQTTRM